MQTLRKGCGHTGWVHKRLLPPPSSGAINSSVKPWLKQIGKQWCKDKCGSRPNVSSGPSSPELGTWPESGVRVPPVCHSCGLVPWGPRKARRSGSLVQPLSWNPHLGQSFFTHKCQFRRSSISSWSQCNVESCRALGREEIGSGSIWFSTQAQGIFPRQQCRT